MNLVFFTDAALFSILITQKLAFVSIWLCWYNFGPYVTYVTSYVVCLKHWMCLKNRQVQGQHPSQ